MILHKQNQVGSAQHRKDLSPLLIYEGYVSDLVSTLPIILLYDSQDGIQ